jgi:hypothetical protein
LFRQLLERADWAGSLPSAGINKFVLRRQRGLSSIQNDEVFMFSTQYLSEFQPYLLSGERLLWSGQPKQGLLLRPNDFMTFFFSLFWTGFSVFWVLMAVKSGAPAFFWLWGLPFVIIGIYLMAGRFLFEMAARRRTYYAVTDQRILILISWPNRSLQALDLKNRSDVTITQEKNGRATLVFSNGNLPAMMTGWVGWMPRNKMYGLQMFEQIENYQMVYRVIRDAQMALG